MPSKADIICGFIATIVFVWDTLTWPIYQIIYRPWQKRAAMYEKKRSRIVRSNSTEIVFETPERTNERYEELAQSGVETIDDLMKWAFKKYGTKPAMGTREILAELDEDQPDGTFLKKYDLGDYKWISYQELDSLSDWFGRGMRQLGLEHRQKLSFYADTRAEWMIAAQACFKQAFTITTLYTNLGEDAIIYGLNQTQATHVITSHDLLPKLRSILTNTHLSVTTIVYIEHQIKSADTTGFPKSIQVVPFKEVVNNGQKLMDDENYVPNKPVKNDPAIIMYTSGSTGVPKGVILTHQNMVASIFGAIKTFYIGPTPPPLYLAFLPLAHILELGCECLAIVNGMALGYSSPTTLTDNGSMIKQGNRGDATLLKPTMIVTVPVMLDRISKAIKEKVKKGSPIAQKFFYWAYEYRLAAIKNGESTPILDAIVFKKIRALLGGSLTLMVGAGAPLCKETHEFMRVCLGVPVWQGYGCTEVIATASLTDNDEIGTENVGNPYQGVQVKLINWEEGGYLVTDKPYPRGEIVVGGNQVAAGYFLMEEKTKEDFYEEDGRRWFQTGDIGQLMPDGVFKLIDRKKDLIKLQHGEFVSLGKVEAVLKTCPLVENICIYAKSTESYCIGLVVPDRKQLDELTQHKFGTTYLDFETQCQDEALTGEVLNELLEHGKKYRLEKFELPKAITLVKEVWDPDSGLVTASFKVKRRPLQDFYQEEINRLYNA